MSVSNKTYTWHFSLAKKNTVIEQEICLTTIETVIFFNL